MKEMYQMVNIPTLMVKFDFPFNVEQLTVGAMSSECIHIK